MTMSRAIQHDRPMVDPMTKADRKRVAIHEAGHAVIALHYGFELRPKRCIVFGTCGCGSMFSRKAGEALHEAVVLIAGLASERLLAVLTEDSITAAENDVMQLAEILHCSREEMLRTCWPTLHEQASTILARYRPAIAAIANALEERGALDRSEVEVLFKGSGHSP